jgi:hypothetical protein
VQHRLAAPRRPGAANRRRQPEAGFVEKNQVGVTLAGGGGYLREAHVLPMLDGRFIAFARLPTRLLRRPLQVDAQKAAYMIVMESNSKVALNKLHHTGTRPQLVGPAVSLRSFDKQRFQALILLGGQAWRRTAMRFGRQAVRLSRIIEPTV